LQNKAPLRIKAQGLGFSIAATCILNKNILQLNFFIIVHFTVQQQEWTRTATKVKELENTEDAS